MSKVFNSGGGLFPVDVFRRASSGTKRLLGMILLKEESQTVSQRILAYENKNWQQLTGNLSKHRILQGDYRR